jgi:hypothetical protein
MVFLQEEIERRQQAGASGDELSVGDAELDSFVKEIEDQIKEEYPEGGHEHRGRVRRARDRRSEGAAARRAPLREDHGARTTRRSIRPSRSTRS